MSWWNKVTLPDGRERYNAKTATMSLNVQDSFDGRPFWFVYDASGNTMIASGSSCSVEDAMRAAEHAMLMSSAK